MFFSPARLARGMSVVIALLTPAGVLGQAIVIDHTCTDLNQIPAMWIDEAKTLTLHFAHTSHGSQLVSGAGCLEQLIPFYSVAVRASGSEGLPPVETPPALRVYDGNPPDTYIGPDAYWATEAGRARTRGVANTGHYDASMWSWCGELSWVDQSYVQTYLDVMSQFEGEYPAMRFLLMTGHTDGSGVAGGLNTRNNQIRAYALAHGKVLFDFADIESHDPNGNSYLALGCNDNGDYSGGNWCSQWCAAHPGSPLCTGCSCAHSQALICNLKGRAFWWMMARLAGWPGPEQPEIVMGDCNCDGAVNFFDIDPFVAALSGPVSYGAQFPNCQWLNADCDEDGDVDFMDIDPFVAVLGS